MDRRQHDHLVRLAQLIGDVSALDFVPTTDDRWVEIAQDQDPHGRDRNSGPPRGFKDQAQPMQEIPVMYATDVRNQLLMLREERALALEFGFGDDRVFMEDLDRDIADCQEAWVGAAVTEIAMFRAAIAGPQQG